MSRALTETANVDSVIARLTQATADVVKGSNARIALVDPTGLGARWFAGLHETNDRPDAAYAAMLTECIDVRLEPFSLHGSNPSIPKPLADRWHAQRRAHSLIVPLWDDGTLLGVAEIWNDAASWTFSREDVDVVAAMSREATLASATLTRLNRRGAAPTIAP